MSHASPPARTSGVTLTAMAYELVRLVHPESGRVRTTGLATAQKWLDQGWEFDGESDRDGTPLMQEPDSPPAVEQDDEVSTEEV